VENNDTLLNQGYIDQESCEASPDCSYEFDEFEDGQSVALTT